MTAGNDIYVPHKSIADKVAYLQSNFSHGLTKSLSFRLQQLDNLETFLLEREDEIYAALHQDLGKPAIEAYATEMAILLAEIHYTKKHLKKWMQPRRVKSALITQPGKSYIYAEPRGLVMIISPWNYPLQLALVPFVGAMAAGNCAIIKPSEISSATSQLLARYLPEYIDKRCLQIIEGGIPETTALLKQKADYIFYTGNPAVGRIVMRAAADNLTPVTLELGGKCPCIVDQSADLDVAAKRIVWGKFTNAGQTCIAPDYLLVHEDVVSTLIVKIKDAIRKFYGDYPENSPDYGRIINRQHIHRLTSLLNNGGDIVIGGNTNAENLYFSPTVVQHVPSHSPLMQEEIFGPILPVVTIKSISDATHYINQQPKPLALYFFSTQKAAKEYLIANTSSGGVCVNHTMLQVASPTLPFGGVGESGMGAYHGKSSFDTFTHYKPVLFKSTWFDPSILYPPYTAGLKKLLGWIL